MMASVDSVSYLPVKRVHHMATGKRHGGRYVLYWMHAAQRTVDNHALEYAAICAHEKRLPLLVLFCVIPSLPNATARHYAFMLEGIDEVARSLSERGIGLIVRKGDPVRVVGELCEDAALLVTDMDYVRMSATWRAQIASMTACDMVMVETNVVVPVGVASHKEEYSAATIRPKIWHHASTYLVPPSSDVSTIDSSDWHETELLQRDRDKAIRSLTKLRDGSPAMFVGGTNEALRLLSGFLDTKLASYAKRRNDPTGDVVSHMSPYLHFGQIFPLTIATMVMGREGAGVDAYLEELIVRRELAVNFVHYNTHYDSLQGISSWARTTLEEHERDRREHVYDYDELAGASTHDPYWNAAQQEMVRTGKMHGYMRMYWGKKILEWSESPSTAYETAIALNNRFELDGRDPNGYAGVAWCFGNHDRAWKERPVFGKVRYMNARGLERKFDMGRYVEHVNTLS